MNRKIQPAEIYFAFFSFEGSLSHPRTNDFENYFYEIRERFFLSLFLCRRWCSRRWCLVFDVYDDDDMCERISIS